jgi:hypothetical protein
VSFSLDSISVQALVFFGLLLLFQSILIFWSFRRDASVAALFLVALFPFAGVPIFLYRNRSQVRDNHIAGALTYLVLIISAFVFLLWYPKAMEDDIPWALIHTMQFFSFLGLANLVMAPFGE